MGLVGHAPKLTGSLRSKLLPLGTSEKAVQPLYFLRHDAPREADRVLCPTRAPSEEPTTPAMAPITTSIVPLVALFLDFTTAFVTPAGRGGRWPAPHAQAASAIPVSASISRCRPSSATLQMSTSDASDTAEQRAQKLRDAAAAMRAQATELEEKQKRERREGADKSFLAFDSDRDGAVGIAELRAGLEGPLRKTFAASLTARMGRKPTPEEVRVSYEHQLLMYLWTSAGPARHLA